MANLLADGWKDLDTGGSSSVSNFSCLELVFDLPITDKTDVLAVERDSIVPIGCVQELSLVLVKTWNCWPPPVVQNSAGINEDVAVIVDLLAGFQVLGRHIISALLVVPVGTGDEMLGLDIFT